MNSHVIPIRAEYVVAHSAKGCLSSRLFRNELIDINSAISGPPPVLSNIVNP